MPDSNKPKVGALNHASIPVRNLKEAKRFYTEVLGGEIVLESNPKFAEVRVGGAIIGLSEQAGGWTGPNAEFPHYAFTMTGENFIRSSSTSRPTACELISRGPGTAWKRSCIFATRRGIFSSSIASVG
jgi:hypothetical protein